MSFIFLFGIFFIGFSLCEFDLIPNASFLSDVLGGESVTIIGTTQVRDRLVALVISKRPIIIFQLVLTTTNTIVALDRVEIPLTGMSSSGCFSGARNGNVLLFAPDRSSNQNTVYAWNPLFPAIVQAITLPVSFMKCACTVSPSGNHAFFAGLEVSSAAGEAATLSTEFAAVDLTAWPNTESFPGRLMSRIGFYDGEVMARSTPNLFFFSETKLGIIGGEVVSKVDGGREPAGDAVLGILAVPNGGLVSDAVFQVLSSAPIAQAFASGFISWNPFEGLLLYSEGKTRQASLLHITSDDSFASDTLSVAAKRLGPSFLQTVGPKGFVKWNVIGGKLELATISRDGTNKKQVQVMGLDFLPLEISGSEVASYTFANGKSVVWLIVTSTMDSKVPSYVFSTSLSGQVEVMTAAPTPKFVRETLGGGPAPAMSSVSSVVANQDPADVEVSVGNTFFDPLQKSESVAPAPAVPASFNRDDNDNESMFIAVAVSVGVGAGLVVTLCIVVVVVFRRRNRRQASASPPASDGSSADTQLVVHRKRTRTGTTGAVRSRRGTIKGTEDGGVAMSATGRRLSRGRSAKMLVSAAAASSNYYSSSPAVSGLAPNGSGKSSQYSSVVPVATTTAYDSAPLDRKNYGTATQDQYSHFCPHCNAIYPSVRDLDIHIHKRHSPSDVSSGISKPSASTSSSQYAVGALHDFGSSS